MSNEKLSDQISLADLFKILGRYKRLLIGLPMLAAILAVVLVTFVLHPTWEASAILEIGKLGQGQGQQVLIEPAGNVVARMMSPSFVKGAIQLSNESGISAEQLKGFYSTLKVNQIKGIELVEIKLRGPSAEMAEKLVNGVILNLQKAHTEMMAVTITRNKKQLQILTEDIQKAEVEIEQLRKKLLASHNWNAFDATLSATLLKDKTTDLRGMIQQKLTLEEQLSPSRTYTSRLVDEISVSDGPVSPKKLLILSLAIVLGFLSSILIAFIHHALKRVEN